MSAGGLRWSRHALQQTRVAVNINTYVNQPLCFVRGLDFPVPRQSKFTHVAVVSS